MRKIILTSLIAFVLTSTAFAGTDGENKLSKKNSKPVKECTECRIKSNQIGWLKENQTFTIEKMQQMQDNRDKSCCFCYVFLNLNRQFLFLWDKKTFGRILGPSGLSGLLLHDHRLFLDCKSKIELSKT